MKGDVIMTIGEIVEELIYIKDHAPLSRREITAVEEACNLLDRMPELEKAISALGE